MMTSGKAVQQQTGDDENKAQAQSKLGGGGGQLTVADGEGRDPRPRMPRAAARC